MAFVQATGAFSGSEVASLSKAFDSAITEGNDLIVSAGERNSAWSITFSDSETNSYAEDIAGDHTISAGGGHSFGVSAAEITVTATPDTSNYLSLGITEWSDIDSYDTGDETYAFNATSVAASYSTNFADVCISFTHSDFNVGAWTSGPTGYDERYEGDSDGGNFGISVWTKIQESSGGETPEVEWTDSGRATIIAVGYQQSAAPPPAGQPYFKRMAGIPHSITYRRW